ncbi:MAG: hypothetical protein A4E53_02546 [Pelotomaculum sp. PtaB.Bin104]|nr:MAG: hypothetical protein A4E53_02546 [Pelotomaculum sp. PtaB.Bin104]OPY61732.1 MAG: hypothetical protein A4E56_01851 [Pelotomaculum sp. PtaU1.Bin065]
MKKLLLVATFITMIFTSVLTTTAFASEIKMVPVRAYAENRGDVVYFEMTGGYIPQVFVFTKPPTEGKEYADIYQFVDCSQTAYINGVPFDMPARAYIGDDDRMYIPETVAEML